jgi:Protein of unknown function (DUF1214)
VEAFWSISVYNAEVHFVMNPRGAYTVNSVTAQRDKDGSVTVRFGGCDEVPPTACRSSPVGTTWSGCTGHGSVALGEQHVEPRQRSSGYGAWSDPPRQPATAY